MQGLQGNIGNLHPMKIDKILYEKGNYKIKNIIRVNRNKLEIQFETYLDANNFVHSDIGVKYNIKIYIPSHHTQVIGIIRGMDTELSVDEIKEQLRTEENYEILHVYRFHRKYYSEAGEIQYLPTQTIKVTFKAQHLPKRAYIYFTINEVETYNIPILQCRKCQKYGHYAKYCQNASIC